MIERGECINKSLKKFCARGSGSGVLNQQEESPSRHKRTL